MLQRIKIQPVRCAIVLLAIGTLLLIASHHLSYPKYGHPRYQRARRAAIEAATGSISFFEEYNRWPLDVGELTEEGNKRSILFLSTVGQHQFRCPVPLTYQPLEGMKPGRIVYWGRNGNLGSVDDVTWEFTSAGIEEHAMFPEWVLPRL